MKRNNLVSIIVLLVVPGVVLLVYYSMVGGRMPHKVMAAMSEVSSVQGKTPQEICLEHNCPMHQCGMRVRAHLKPGEKIKCPICGEYIAAQNSKIIPVGPLAKKERKIIAYRNPMNSEVTSPVPMKDAMGMEYVPVYEESGAAAPSAGISISPEKQKLMGIGISPVVKRDLVKIVHASGKIAYDPELVVTQEEFIQALKV